MLSELSRAILVDLERHTDGVKLVDLQERLRKPPQEIEAAMSQLMRLGHTKQRSPGVWIRLQYESRGERPEPDHARIRETGVIDRRPELDAPSVPAPIPLRREPEPAIQERTMPIGKRKCARCETLKGNRAFEKGAEACRECNGTNKASKPKADKPARAKGPKKARAKRSPRTKLRTIVAKHTRRGDEDPALAALRARRDRLSKQLAAVDQAIDVLERAA